MRISPFFCLHVFNKLCSVTFFFIIFFLEIPKGPLSDEISVCDQFRGIKDEFQRELDALNEAANKCASGNEALKSDICSLKCHLTSARNQREQAENDARALCKQLEKEKDDQRREREELCRTIKKKDGQIQTELHIGYESKLQKLLNDLRNQFKDKMCIAGVEIVKRIIDSHGGGESNWGADVEIDKLEIEKQIEINFKIISELQGKLTECTTKLNKLKIQVDRHKREHGKNLDTIRRMQQELVALLNQYQDLIDIKLLLDFELAAYNQMLAVEEYRLNVSDMCEDTPPSQSSSTTKRKGDKDDTVAKRGK